MINVFSINAVNAFVTVGDASDSDCNYSDLQSALDSGDSEIRMSKQSTFAGNYISNNQDLNLQGGFINCDAAIQNILLEGNKSEIKSNGNGNGHVLAINGTVSIENSLIHNNTATQGGGIFINDTDTEVIIKNSSISDNIANARGGGIYCVRASIIIDSTSLLSNNQVFDSQGAGEGGGLYANLCHIEIYAGNSDGISAGFIGNQSVKSGGGIYAVSSNLILNGQQESIDNPILGDNTQPVLFKDNSSNSSSAALYISVSNVDIKAVWFDGNQAPSASVMKAIYGTVVNMGRDEDQPCWRENFCNLVTNNNDGIAIDISHSPTTAVITNTEFTNNTANWTGLIRVSNITGYDVGNDLFFTFEGNLVHHNTSTRVGLLKTDSIINDHCCHMTVDVFNNTITNNQFSNYVFNITDDTTFNMHSNIIYEDVALTPAVQVLNSAYTDANISCLISHDINSLPNITLSTIVADPLFVNATNNFRYGPTNPRTR